MALKIYVGSLTRYYSGDWENAAEKIARKHGVPYHMGKPGSDKDMAKEAERIRSTVVAWRRKLSVSLEERIESHLDWDEGADTPYFSERLGWDGFGSLVLWAAYAEHPTIRRPAVLPEGWDEDHALKRSNAEGFKSRYSHLVRNIELWLPSAFELTFEAEDPRGRRTVIGSATTLRKQLADLNVATWKADRDERAAWKKVRPADGAGLEECARFAFSHLCHLVKQACQHELPMKLDY